MAGPCDAERGGSLWTGDLNSASAGCRAGPRPAAAVHADHGAPSALIRRGGPRSMFDSNSRWRFSVAPAWPRPNIDPHRTTGSRNGAPTTFSMTYGNPDAISASRVALSRAASHFDRRWDGSFADLLRRDVYSLHGGEAATATNWARKSRSRRYARASPWCRSRNGYEGIGARSTPVTSNPAWWYPMEAPPHPQNTSRRRGRAGPVTG